MIASVTRVASMAALKSTATMVGAGAGAGRGLRPSLCQAAREYHVSRPVHGFEEFAEVKKPNELVTTGRAWTVADVRRKVRQAGAPTTTCCCRSSIPSSFFQSFDDLHKLWFVLYKECNLLLSEREKARRNVRPVLAVDEQRYTKVKRSMAAIKQVLGERQRINDKLKRQTPS